MIAVRQIITLHVISSNSVRIGCVCCAMQVALRGMVYTAMVINGVSLILVGGWLFGALMLFASFLLIRFC